LPKESFYLEPFSFIEYIFGSPFVITVDAELTSDGFGKLYTNDGVGDVDIKSMTNDTGTFFWKDGTWHPEGEEWIGDGTLDPAGSSWLYAEGNITYYLNGTFWCYKTDSNWYTTGYSENTVMEPTSRLDNSHMNTTGVPFTDVNGTVTYVNTHATLNRAVCYGLEDIQSTIELAGGSIPVSSGTLFSPADLYVTDPLNRSIGTHPNGTIVIPQIPDAFYTGPSSEPERIIIPNPLNGTYKILITGTGNGTFAFMVDFALSTNITERTKDVYYGDIADGGVLWSKIIVSGGEVTSFTPVSTIGDVNQDGIVDIVDIVICALAYESMAEDNPETPQDETEDWNALADLNLDRIIDIVDIIMIAIHYEETVW